MYTNNCIYWRSKINNRCLLVIVVTFIIYCVYKICLRKKMFWLNNWTLYWLPFNNNVCKFIMLSVCILSIFFGYKNITRLGTKLSGFSVIIRLFRVNFKLHLIIVIKLILYIKFNAFYRHDLWTLRHMTNWVHWGIIRIIKKTKCTTGHWGSPSA